MIGTISAAPSLADLYKLISKVPGYPLSNQQLVNLAAKLHAPQEVIDFYRSFGRQIYNDEYDLSTRTEQVDLMRQEERDMPKEELRAADDF
jgi:hypothetical protein